MRTPIIIVSLLFAIGLGIAVYVFSGHRESAQLAEIAETSTEVVKPVTTKPDTEKPLSPAASTPEDLLQTIVSEGSARFEFAAVSSILRHFHKPQKNDNGDPFAQGGAYSPEAFEAVYRKKLTESLNTEELKALDKLGRFALMHQFTQAEREFLADPSLTAAALYARQFKTNPPSSERLSLLKKLDDDARLSAQTFASLNTLSKALQQLAKKVSRRTINEALVRKGMLIKLNECLKDSNEDEIKSLRQIFIDPIKQKELALRHAAIVETLQTFRN